MTVPPDPRAQRPGLQQIGEVSAQGNIATWDSNGRIQDSAEGPVFLPGLPTSDPHQVGRLWNSSGTLMISAG